MCQKRITVLSSLTGGNLVNSPQLPSPVDANSVDANSIPPVAESSAQGAARAIRESAEEGFSRAR